MFFKSSWNGEISLLEAGLASRVRPSSSAGGDMKSQYSSPRCAWWSHQTLLTGLGGAAIKIILDVYSAFPAVRMGVTARRRHCNSACKLPAVVEDSARRAGTFTLPPDAGRHRQSTPEYSRPWSTTIVMRQINGKTSSGDTMAVDRRFQFTLLQTMQGIDRHYNGVGSSTYNVNVL